jgi:hypothetical protein
VIRTVVYDAPDIQAAYASQVRAQGAGPLSAKSRRQIRNQVRKKAAASAAAASGATAQPQADSLQTKLVKYVPVEVVSVSAAGFAAFNPTGNWIWFGMALGVIANVVYLFVAAVQSTDATHQRPRWYFYLLSAVAFVVWSIATISSIQGSLHLTEAKASFILFAGAFGIPLLDSLFGVLDLTIRAPKAATATP